MECFLSILEEIKIFLQEKGPTLKTKSGAYVLMLSNDNTWLVDLIFLVDITKHMNNLCIRMQGRKQLFPELLNAVDPFQSKLFQKQLSTGNMKQFKIMSLFLEKTKENLVSDSRSLPKCVETFVKTFQNAFKILMGLF